MIKVSEVCVSNSKGWGHMQGMARGWPWLATTSIISPPTNGVVTL